MPPQLLFFLPIKHDSFSLLVCHLSLTTLVMLVTSLVSSSSSFFCLHPFCTHWWNLWQEQDFGHYSYYSHPIAHIRKLKHSAIKSLAQHHTTNKEWLPEYVIITLTLLIHLILTDMAWRVFFFFISQFTHNNSVPAMCQKNWNLSVWIFWDPLADPSTLQFPKPESENIFSFLKCCFCCILWSS